MSWRDHLQQDGATVTLPWTGGRTLFAPGSSYAIEGRLPPEYGWYAFEVYGRKAKNPKATAPWCSVLHFPEYGYLVGDRLVPDARRDAIPLDPQALAQTFEPVYLLEDGLDRFARVLAGRVALECRLIFHSPAMPQGPEEEVLQAYLDRKGSLKGIKGVTPGLDAAFRLESWERSEADRRRAELERQRREEEERRQREEQRRELAQKLGDGVGRRQMAVVDFVAAARAALAVGGAEFLDERRGYNRGERVVRYRLDRQRFECVCEERTLRIIESGICLRNEHTGEQGDDRFTLESLPAVVKDAQRLGVLVVLRHI